MQFVQLQLEVPLINHIKSIIWDYGVALALNIAVCLLPILKLGHFTHLLLGVQHP